MTSSYINSLFTSVVLVVTLFSCNNQPAHDHTASLHQTDTALVEDIKRINGSYASSVETIVPESGIKIFSLELDGVVAYDSRNAQSISSRVDGRIEKLFVRYTRQQVKKGQKIMEIYSPQLASAQREMIYVAGTGDNDLLAKAKARVRLLGLTDQQINEVIATGKVKYSLPVYSAISGYIVEGTSDSMSSDSNSPFYVAEGQYVMAGQTVFNVYNSQRLIAEFSITPALAPYIKVGDEILFSPSYDKNLMTRARVGLIEPVLRAGEQFSVARVYLNNSSHVKVGDVLDATTPVKLTGWWLPATSIWKQGSNAVVYRKTQTGFKPQNVALKTIINGQALVGDGVSDWTVAKNASFFRDSDAFVDPKSNDK